MRRIALISIVAAVLAACSTETTTPAPANDDQIADFSTEAFGTLTSAGGYDADLYQDRLFHALPDSIKLTADQEAKIKALVEAFKQATKADHDAFNAVLREAAQAIRAHKSRAEVKAILDRGIAIRARLGTASSALKTAIDAVLTPEQRAWLASHRPQRCDPSKFIPLTDAQKAQMRALGAAFEQANKADLEAVKAAFAEARAAHAAGKTRAEIQAILEAVKPAIERLDAARRVLHAQLEAILTPEQKASRCFPLG